MTSGRRAVACGWPESAVEVIDTDLGQTAQDRPGPAGFAELVTRVTLGQVGIIFSYDVTRLSRNCSDWYQLLDLCGFRRCLIGDRDGIYDPSSINGRLLLGLKGQISELELHTIKARLTAGLLNKARRGELALSLPVGLVRDLPGRVVKHPDREVRGRIDLIFATFLRVRSTSRRGPRAQRPPGLLVPRRERGRDDVAVVWRRPTGGGDVEPAPQPGLRRDLRLRPDAVPAARARRPVPASTPCPRSSGSSWSPTSTPPTSTGRPSRRSRR